MKGDEYVGKERTSWSNKLNHLYWIMFKTVIIRERDRKNLKDYEIVPMTPKQIMMTKSIIWIFKFICERLAFANITLKIVNKHCQRHNGPRVLSL